MRNKFLGTGDAGYHPLRKVRTVLSGLRYAVAYDFSVAYKLVLSVVLLATGLVLVAEMFNSAIEALCDFVEERHNEKIKVIKDIAAAAVGVTILMWVVVLAFELVEVAAALD